MGGSIFAAHAAQQIASLVQTLGRALRFGVIGLAALICPPHIFGGASHLLQSPLHSRIAALLPGAAGTGHAAEPLLRGRHLAALLPALLTTLLPGLSLLARLALLSLLALLTLLPLLALLAHLAVAGHLLHLFLQLLGFAAQHFLLPSLFRSLLAIGRLLRQLLLAARQLFEPLERFIDFTLTVLAAGCALLAGFVLILFGVELQLEQRLQVAATTSGAATARIAAEGYLDFLEPGFGAEQMLQRLLLVRKRLFPFQIRQVLDGRTHRFGRGFHVLGEGFEGFAGSGKLAGPHALGEGLRLRQQLRLHFG